MTDRRTFLTAALIAPVAIAVPAMAQTFTCTTFDPIPEYLAAFHGYDEDDPAASSRHAKASLALYQWVPTTAHDMLRKVAVMLDDNATAPEASLQRLIAQADRLLCEKS